MILFGTNPNIWDYFVRQMLTLLSCTMIVHVSYLKYRGLKNVICDKTAQTYIEEYLVLEILRRLEKVTLVTDKSYAYTSLLCLLEKNIWTIDKHSFCELLLPPILSVNKYTYLSLNDDKLSALYTKQFIFISEEKTNLENNQTIHLPQEEEDGSYNATAHHNPHPLRPLRDAPGKHILEPCSTPIFCKFDQYFP